MLIWYDDDGRYDDGAGELVTSDSKASARQGGESESVDLHASNLQIISNTIMMIMMILVMPVMIMVVVSKGKVKLFNIAL